MDTGPVFSSQERVAEGRKLGMLVVDLEEGDLLYFPGSWYHEVHNLTVHSKTITNAVPWPEEKKTKGENLGEEEKKEQQMAPTKRSLEELLKEYKEYKDLTMG